MRSARAIVFDLDDTLYPYRSFLLSGFGAVAQHLAAERGLAAHVVLRCLRDALANGHRGRELQALCVRLSLPMSLVPSLAAVILEHRPFIRLPRESVRILAKLRPTWRIGILTNGTPAVQRQKIEALGVKNFVDEIVCAVECGTGSGKPAAEAFHTILEKLQTPPDAAVFVGDDAMTDIAGAAAIGMKTIHVQVCGDESPIDRKSGIRALQEVPEIADRLVPEQKRQVEGFKVRYVS